MLVAGTTKSLSIVGYSTGTMTVEVKPKTAFLVLIFVLLVGIVGSTVIAMGTDDQPVEPSEIAVVPVTNTSVVWPYTSRTQSFAGRTLALNIVIHGDGETIRHRLTSEGRGDWNETREDDSELEPRQLRSVVDEAPNITWGEATGANRYMYVESTASSDGGVWIAESFQLHDGTYLGSRHHIRAYESPFPGDGWVVLQAHREHWDWFRLRHVVDSEEEAQSYVERDIERSWSVREYHRINWGNDETSLDANGWTTEVFMSQYVAGGLIGVFVGVLSLVGHGVTRGSVREWWRQFRAMHPGFVPSVFHGLILIGVVVGVLLFVRFASIYLERVTDLPPKVIAGPFYGFLVVSLPVGTYLSARKLAREQAFGVAVVGFTIGFILDYAVVGIHVLPIDLLIHRFVLAVSIGFIAAGASKSVRTGSSRSGLVRSGVLLWVTALFLPLLYFV